MSNDLAVRLGHTVPITLEPLMRAVAAHAVPGIETCDLLAARHSRTVRGDELVVTVEWDEPGSVRLSVVDHDGDAPVDDALVATVRRWLDLDREVEEIDAHLAQSGTLAPLVAARPGLRILGSVDGFETAAMTVIGQQVSLGAARTFGGRLVAALGGDAPAGFRSFPTAEAVAAVDVDTLRSIVGLTGARAATVSALAHSVASGDLLLGMDDDPHAARAALLAVRGIGPWTADYVALRLFGDRDAYPADDLVLKKALGVRTGTAAARLSEDWAPWRAYAVTHLWTQTAFS